MPGRVPDINLLPKYERENSGLYYLFIILLIITVIGYIVIGYFYFTTKSKLADATAEYEQLADEADILKVRVAELESSGGNLDRSIAFVENYDMSTSYIIEELVDLLPEDSYLVDYTYSNQQTDIVTHFETLDTLTNYTSKLLASNYFNDMRLSNIDTFHIDETEEMDEFETIPRYEANYTVDINRHHVKGVEEEDE